MLLSNTLVTLLIFLLNTFNQLLEKKETGEHPGPRQALRPGPAFSHRSRDLLSSAQ
jgi:hypothetical protein